MKYLFMILLLVGCTGGAERQICYGKADAKFLLTVETCNRKKMTFEECKPILDEHLTEYRKCP